MLNPQKHRTVGLRPIQQITEEVIQDLARTIKKKEVTVFGLSVLAALKNKKPLAPKDAQG